ncbi:hypothetical protein NL676_009501 [Syzygium grande]|nr:hypothetical protein NL676_009501 [Syzygium grande]
MRMTAETAGYVIADYLEKLERLMEGVRVGEPAGEGRPSVTMRITTPSHHTDKRDACPCKLLRHPCRYTMLGPAYSTLARVCFADFFFGSALHPMPCQQNLPGKFIASTAWLAISRASSNFSPWK